MLLVQSCQLTKNQASRKIDRIQREQPIVLAEKCASTFDNTDSVYENIQYIFGIDTVYKTDTTEILVDCKNDTVIKKIKVPLTKYVLRVDTLTKVKFERENNSALLLVKNSQIDSLTNSLVKVKTQKETILNQRNISYYILAFILIGVIIYLYFKLR